MAPAITANEMVPGGSYKGYGDPNTLNIPSRLGSRFTDLNTGNIWIKKSDDLLPTGWVTPGGSFNNLTQFGSTDDGYAALTAAMANSDHVLIDDIFSVSDNLTIATGKVLIFTVGGKLKPASGKKITINGEVQAGRYEIFDYSAGGKVVLGFFSLTDHLFPEWYGAVANNSFNNDTAFSRLFDQTLSTSENQQPILLDIGYYNFVAGFTCRSRTIITGRGKTKTRLQYGPTSTGRFISVPDGCDHIVLNELQINCLTVGAGVRTTAIGHSTSGYDVSNVETNSVTISGFNQYGLDFYEVQYAKIIDTEFSSISNLTSLGGSGAGSALCMNFRTFANAVVIAQMTKVANCEAFLYSSNSTSITVEGCSFEQSSAGGTLIDAITGKTHFIEVSGGNIRIQENYFEGIRAVVGKALIYFDSVQAWSVYQNSMVGLRPGGSSSVVDVFIQQGLTVYGGDASGNRFYGTPTWYVLVNGASAGPIFAFQNVFINDAGTVLTSFAAIFAKMTPALMDFSTPTELNFSRLAIFRQYSSTTNILTALQIAKKKGGVAGAAGDGVAIQVRIDNSSGSEQNAGQLQWRYIVATDSGETSNQLTKLLGSGAVVDASEHYGLGGMKVRGDVHPAVRMSAIDTSVIQADGDVYITAASRTATIINSTNLPIGYTVRISLYVGSAATGTVAFANGSDRIQPSNAATYSLSADGKTVQIRLVAANTWFIVGSN